eukprot:6883595-Pyramimonas_sp.AAC.1
MEELARLEEQQTARLHELFERIDQSGDGRLTMGELTKAPRRGLAHHQRLGDRSLRGPRRAEDMDTRSRGDYQ